MIITVPSFNLSSIGPWLTLTIAAIFILLLDAFSPKGRKSIFPILALLALAVAAWQTYCLWGKVGLDFSRMVYLDNFAFYFYLIIILGTALTILLSPHYLEEFGKNIGEYYALVLFAAVGMLLMAASAHFIMIFLGLEICPLRSMFWPAFSGKTLAATKPRSSTWSWELLPAAFCSSAWPCFMAPPEVLCILMSWPPSSAPMQPSPSP